jgi:hypothetical protein
MGTSRIGFRYFRFLAGMSRESCSIPDTSYADSAMACCIGGGKGLRRNGRFGVRVIQMDHLRTKLADRWLDNGRTPVGIVWRLGRKQDQRHPPKKERLEPHCPGGER